MIIPPWIKSVASWIWSLVSDRSIIIPIACSLAIWIQFEYRIPGSFLFLLIPVVGIALLILSLYFLINHLLAWVRPDDPFRLTLDRIEWWSSLLVRVFVYYSLLLFVNAKLDTSKPVYRTADVVRVSEEARLGFPTSYLWINLRYRDDPGKTERMLLKLDERAATAGSAPMAVTVRSGFLGIPWVVAIERDWDVYAKEILKLAPNAALVWKELTYFYFTHNRWKEGADAAQEYLKQYRRDYNYALEVGGSLMLAFQYAAAVPFYDLVVRTHPSYHSYQMLGYALSFSGNNQRAAEVFEASIALDPDDYEAYYHLGYVYGGMGRLAEGIAAFEKALERRPNSLEVEIELKRLRKALAAVQAAHQAVPKRREQINKPSP